MKNIPSIGFAYLLSVFIVFVGFLSWVAGVGWYDRIGTPQQKRADPLRYSNYLEKISDDFADSQKRIDIMVEAAQIKNNISQPQKALVILEKALILNPDDESINKLLIPLYWDFGQKKKAIKLANGRFEARQRNWGIFYVLLESRTKKTDPEKISKVVQDILETKFPEKQIVNNGQITTIGMTKDQWTYNGKPGFLIVSESNVRLQLSCYASPQDTPITVKIEDQDSKIIFSHVFHSTEDIDLELPALPVGANRLFIIKTDKYWIPNNDNRRLGVKVTPLT